MRHFTFLDLLARLSLISDDSTVTVTIKRVSGDMIRRLLAILGILDFKWMLGLQAIFKVNGELGVLGKLGILRLLRMLGLLDN